MSFYHIGGECCPAAGMSVENELYQTGQSPLLYLWESVPALILPQRVNSRLPCFPGSPPMLGGRGVMLFSLIARDAETRCLPIVCKALARLDVTAQARGGVVFAAGCPCGVGEYIKNTGAFRGVLYYSADQAELNRCAPVLGQGFMSLSRINPNLSRSYLFGTLVYCFELEYGKASPVHMPCAASSAF